MFNTVFDKSLDDFFYADTCTENKVGFDRQNKKNHSNFFGNNLRVKTFALGACFVTGIVSGGNVYGMSAEGVRDKRMQVAEATSSRQGRLDERTRLDLIKKILKAREEFKLSQDDLAKLINVSKFTVSNFERGEHSPDLNSLAKYNKFLELADYLNNKLNGKKFAIRQLFRFDSPIFDGMNPVNFAHAVGEEGLNEVIYSFKRQYG